MDEMGYEPECVVNISFWFTQLTDFWNRGSPHPGPVPNGYFTCRLPQVSLQAHPAAEGTKSRQQRESKRAPRDSKARSIAGGGGESEIRMLVERLNLRIQWGVWTSAIVLFIVAGAKKKEKDKRLGNRPKLFLRVL